jgi:ABC-type antimicrobial peptide transport system permease subunit
MPRPPRLAKLLVRLFASPERNDAYLGDIEESFAERAASRGVFRARAWYWKEALGSLPDYLGNSIVWSWIMFKNNLKTAFRGLKRQKGYSFLNIAGLAAGIACALLIWLWVQDELSFDRFHLNSSTLYRTDYIRLQPDGSRGGASSSTPYPMGPAIQAEIPEIAEMTRIGNPGTLLIQAGEKSFYEETLRAVDPAFLRMFTFPLIRGEADTVLSRPLSIVISRDMADKYFPGEDPLGRTLTINNDYSFSVSGVMRNPPSNSSLRPQFLVPLDHMEDLRSTKDYWKNINRWDLGVFQTWVQLRDPRTAPAVERKIRELVRRQKNGNTSPWALAPLLNLRLAASRADIFLFSGLAFFVLLVACINFMNLTTARAANRAKEIGLRKVVGAFRKNIVVQFYQETFLSVFLSVLAAAAFFILLLPPFRLISGKMIGLGAVWSWRFGLGILAIFLLTGFLAGSYPSFVLSSFHPARTLKGHWRAGARSAAFRKILVVFQFALSAFLLLGTGIVYRQVNHMRTMKLGYDKDHLIYLSLRNDTVKTYLPLKSDLQTEPLVRGVTASFQLPMNNEMRETGTSWEGKGPKAETYVFYDAVDYDYIETLGLSLIAGRAFSRDFAGDENGAFLINEKMAKQMNLSVPSEAIGRALTSWGVTGPIVGVLKDYHFQSARNIIEPQVVSLVRAKTSRSPERYAVFRLTGGRIQDSLDKIKSAWKKINPGHPFEYRFFDEAFDTMYRSDERLGAILKYFAVVGVLIACLGLFGLASFTAAQRTKEIGVRKVLGASTKGLVVLLSREFLVWVAVANLLAWPVAFLIMNNWLRNFASQAGFGWWLYVAVGAGSLAAAFATVGYQTLRAARANPVKALKYE